MLTGELKGKGVEVTLGLFLFIKGGFLNKRRRQIVSVTVQLQRGSGIKGNGDDNREQTAVWVASAG